MNGDTTARPALPETCRREVEALLEPGEALTAFLLTDLDEQLSYREGLLALTDRRLLSFDAIPPRPAGAERPGPRAWPLDRIVSLKARDRGGLGTLEAEAEDVQLGRWPYTVGRARAVADFVDAFEALRSGGRSAAAGGDGEGVPEAEQQEAPVRVGSLFRLYRFARPHLAALVLGVVLTLATTAAGLVPPYLTWPLVDEILAPYQSRVEGIRTDVRLSCACKRTQTAGWKSPPGRRSPPVTECNCVAARRGGEQQEVKDRPEG